MHIPKGTPAQITIQRPGELKAVFDWTLQGLDWAEIVERLHALRRGALPARLDADRTAVPQTHLIACVEPGRRWNGRPAHIEHREQSSREDSEGVFRSGKRERIA